jgi:hypothetical protein
MRHVKLTDDELWRAIAQNTDEMSELVHQFDTDVRMGIFFLPCARSRSYLEAVNKFEREYQEYTAELRRRHPASDVIAVTEVEETRQVSRAGRRDCAEIREGRGIMNVLRSVFA